jgi:hypothetical protein
MATAFNPLNGPTIIHNNFTEQNRFHFNEGWESSKQVTQHTTIDCLKKSPSYKHYKSHIINFLEEANKSYALPTVYNGNYSLYTSQSAQIVIELLKEDKSVKKCFSRDDTKDYFTNAPDIV